MCNLSEGIREKAEKKGLKRGEKIGEERGAERATLENALNLMKSLKMSAEDVLQAMRVPTKRRPALLKSINDRLAAE